MNERTFHQETIRGLIRHTINRTHLDLEQRGQIAVGNIVDWTNLRTFDQEINNLFRSPIYSRRERIAINNLIIEVQRRINHFTAAIPDVAAFEESIREGTRAYSRYIKQNTLYHQIQIILEDFFNPLKNNFVGEYLKHSKQIFKSILE